MNHACQVFTLLAKSQNHLVTAYMKEMNRKVRGNCSSKQIILVQK